MDAARFGESANAAEFDIDDAAGAQFDRSSGISRIVNAFIQADRSSNFRLQFGVAVNFVPLQWLLHHQEIEFIELLQMFGIGQSVSGICIYRKLNRGETDRKSVV